MEKHVHQGGENRAGNIIYLMFLVIVWASSFSIYKVALGHTPPLLFAGLRSLLAGLLLGIWIVYRDRGAQIRWRQCWPIYLLSALLNTVLFYGFQTVGIDYLPSGLMSVLVYFQPVLIGVLAWIWFGEAMNALRIIGLVLGFLGVVAVSWEGIHGQVSAAGIACGLAAAVSWAVGSLYVKKVFQQVDAMWMLTWQSLIGGAVLTVIGLGTEDWTAIAWNMPFWAGMLFGGTLGIPAAFYIYFKMISLGEASRIASVTYLVPLLAVIIGTVFLSEPLSASLLIGFALIGSGIYLTNRNPGAPAK
jgi:Permeases of the drug/metabolite transporter (DMT) superfamily